MWHLSCLPTIQVWGMTGIPTVPRDDTWQWRGMAATIPFLDTSTLHEAGTQKYESLDLSNSGCCTNSIFGFFCRDDRAINLDTLHKCMLIIIFAFDSIKSTKPIKRTKLHVSHNCVGMCSRPTQQLVWNKYQLLFCKVIVKKQQKKKNRNRETLMYWYTGTLPPTHICRLNYAVSLCLSHTRSPVAYEETLTLESKF